MKSAGATTSRKASEIRLRRVRISDLDLLVRHRRKMWEDIGDEDPQSLDKADLAYKKWVSTRLKNKTFLGWLATADDEAVAGTGCIWLQPVQPRPGNRRKFQPYLLSMYTEPAYRGRGVATEIVRAAIKWAKQNDFSGMRLHASGMGRGVYQKLGFKRTWEMRIKLGQQRQP